MGKGKNGIYLGYSNRCGKHGAKLVAVGYKGRKGK